MPDTPHAVAAIHDETNTAFTFHLYADDRVARSLRRALVDSPDFSQVRWTVTEEREVTDA